MKPLKLKDNITARNPENVANMGNISCIYPNNVDIYLNKEEKELIHKIKSGNLEANRKIIDNNTPLIIVIANLCYNQGLSMEELIKIGEGGLIIAAKKFDESKGFKFISFAAWYIRQSMINAIEENK